MAEARKEIYILSLDKFLLDFVDGNYAIHGSSSRAANDAAQSTFGAGIRRPVALEAESSSFRIEQNFFGQNFVGQEQSCAQDLTQDLLFNTASACICSESDQLVGRFIFARNSEAKKAKRSFASKKKLFRFLARSFDLRF